MKGSKILSREIALDVLAEAEVALILQNCLGEVLYINRAGRRIFTPGREFIDEAGFPLSEEDLPLNLVASGRAEKIEAFLCYEEDGQKHWVRMHASMVGKEGEKMVLGLAEDVTEQHLCEEEMRVLRLAMQESVCPTELPNISGVDLGAAHTPQVSGFGGDFYDAISVGEKEYLILIGHVSGHGADVISLASLCRYTLRALAPQQSSLPHLLKELNEILLHYHNKGHLVTVLLARIAQIDDGLRVHLVLGGHPQPFLIHDDGRVEGVGRAGALVGAFRTEAEEKESIFLLKPGSALVLFTGNVLDAMSASFHLEEWLQGKQGAEAIYLAEQLTQEAQRRSKGTFDCSALVVRVPEAPILRQCFPAELASIPNARHALNGLRGRYKAIRWNEVDLLVTELVTNALTHGLPEEVKKHWVEVRVSERTGGRLRFAVITPGTQFDAYKAKRSPDFSDPTGRGLFLVDRLASRWGISEDGGSCIWFECDLKDEAL